MERQRAPHGRLVIALAALGALAGIYELLAVTTDLAPTITDLALTVHIVPRVVLVTTALAAAFDHFVTRRWL
jgi:hypothetical protein